MAVSLSKSLELRIIVALLCVVGLVIGVFTFVDIRTMRSATIQAAEGSMAALARTVKGNVNASMQQGYHQDVQRIIDEARTSFNIDRIVLYDDRGKELRTSGADRALPGAGIPPVILGTIAAGDRTDIRERDRASLSYYSAIPNQPACFRCHRGGHPLNGILRIDFSLFGIEKVIADRRNSLLLWTALMIAALMAALVLLLRHLVHKPVEELRKAMALAEEGKTDLSLPVSGTDEFSELKRRFLTMLQRINVLHAGNLEKEKELAHNREVMRFRGELQAMFDAMPDGVLLIDGTMRIVQANPRIYALLPSLEPVGGLVNPDCVKKDCCPFQGLEEALKKGTMVESQCSLSSPGREVLHLHSMCAPIVEDGRIEYIVAVVRDMTERVKTELELEERTAELIAANRQLSQLAVTDGLTQVHNRRYFDELLTREIKRLNRRKYAHLSLMMIDIDHFKALNDRLGHLAGDMVLREVATLLRENVRETDTVARFGGEEFAIVMPDTHLDGAVFRAEELRKKIEDRVLRVHEGSEIRTTVSIGIAGYTAGGGQDLLKEADRALYQAKRSGRNNVIVNRAGLMVQE